jgi:hypothetical protein
VRKFAPGKQTILTCWQSLKGEDGLHDGWHRKQQRKHETFCLSIYSGDLLHATRLLLTSISRLSFGSNVHARYLLEIRVFQSIFEILSLFLMEAATIVLKMMWLSVFGWMWSSKIEMLLSLVISRYTIWHVFTEHKLDFRGYIQHPSLADLKTIYSFSLKPAPANSWNLSGRRHLEA